MDSIRRRLSATIISCGLVLGALAAMPNPASAATPPSQPSVGQLGGDGPCTNGTRREGYASTGNRVWLHVPAGTGTPRTGGSCDDADRPVVFIAPGWSALTPGSYQDLIDNMVSNGYIVVYVNFTLLFSPSWVYPQVIGGYDYAATTLNAVAGNRMDLDNVGVWGHSYGAGMVPWLSQQLDDRGWGDDSMWLSSNATSWVFWVPTTGPIDIPDHARVHVIAYEDDTKVDHRLGIDIFHAYDIPDSQKDHIQILTDGSFVADHTLPGSNYGPPNHLDWYGNYRNYQALGDCAQRGENCGADLTYMGSWSDGQEAPRAIVTDDPDDMGPSPASVECGEASGSSTPSRCGPGSV